MGESATIFTGYVIFACIKNVRIDLQRGTLWHNLTRFAQCLAGLAISIDGPAPPVGRGRSGGDLPACRQMATAFLCPMSGRNS